MKRFILPAIVASLLFGGCQSLEAPALIAPSAPASPDTEEYNTVTGTVAKVRDGDTIEVELAKALVLRGMHLSPGTVIAVRLLLVDTPESVGDKAGMPYGEEASAYLKGLLEGKTVTLEFDEGEVQDHYDRYLSYVYVGEQRVQDLLVKEGLAMIRYVNEPNTRYLDELRALEEEARNADLGIWSIPEYVDLEKGYNEVVASKLHIELESTVKEQANNLKDAVQKEAKVMAEDLADDAINSFFDSFSK